MSGDRFAAARAVADAVLYEGYVLYPYRASSSKNQVRWQFGVLAPPAWAEAEGSERSANRTEVIVETGAEPRLEVRVRCLQAQHRAVEASIDAGGSVFGPVESLPVGDAVYAPWDEAVEREVELGSVDLVGLVADGGRREYPFVLPAGEDAELLRDGNGTVAGRLVRRCEQTTGLVRLAATPITEDEGAGAIRLTVEVENTSPWNEPAALGAAGAGRDEALRRSLLAAHTLLAITGGAFVSSFDPPDDRRGAVKACRNDGTFPVLVGEPGSTDLVLSSPIILYDHPEIAPESPGDLYDATEIDEILALRVLTLTEEEKAEARGTDTRAAAIVDRCDDLPPELWERLHGAIRSIGPVAPAPPGPSGASTLAPWVPEGVAPGHAPVGDGPQPWWDPAVDASVDPWTDTVVVDGVTVAKGAKVRLRPSRRADAHDLFVDGMLATVAGVFHDVDEELHVAVTLDDDPATDLLDWQGRYWFFFPDEVEPVAAGVEPRR